MAGTNGQKSVTVEFTNGEVWLRERKEKGVMGFWGEEGREGWGSGVKGRSNRHWLKKPKELKWIKASHYFMNFFCFVFLGQICWIRMRYSQIYVGGLLNTCISIRALTLTFIIRIVSIRA